MLFKYIYACIVLLFLCPSITFAYIDPATLSYIFSLIVGLIAGLSLYIKYIIHKIKLLISNILLFTIELKCYYIYLFKLDSKYKDIVIYSEGKNYYSYYEGIINELTTRNINISYISSDHTENIYFEDNNNIKYLYINILLIPFMQFLKCKILILTLTDLHNLHLKRSIYPVKYIYVFHSFVSTHMMYRFGAFNYYDSILCGGEHHVKEIIANENLYDLKSKQKIKAGDYRIERIYKAYKQSVMNKNFINSKKTVLIAPSWGDENLLKTCGKILINKLLNSGYKVIVRPHPEMIKRSSQLINDLNHNFSENESYYIESSVASDESLINADYLITDCSGIMFEYAFGTERPVIFFDVPLKIKNDRYKELNIEPLELSLRDNIGILIQVSEIDIMDDIISNLDSEMETYKNKIIELRKDTVYSFNNSSVVSSDYIIDELNKL
jgi:YidC/Oxa1 family membrane protein insertase